MEHKRHPERYYHHVFSSIFIYPMIIPFVILDFCIEIYHNVCFRLYGLPLIDRAKYVKIDRHKLSYLGPFEKINCVYCGYANGLLAYAVQIVAKTEEYWCGIKHKADDGFIEPKHHKDFLKYGDEVAYRNYTRPLQGYGEAKNEKKCKLSKEKIYE